MDQGKRKAYWDGLNPLEKAQFATAIGAKSVNSISQSIQAGQTWGEHRCLLVERYTKGALTRVDLLGDYAYDHWSDIPRPMSSAPADSAAEGVILFNSRGDWAYSQYDDDFGGWMYQGEPFDDPIAWIPCPTIRIAEYGQRADLRGKNRLVD